MTKIGVIFGGMSTEHNISNISGTSVIKHLDKNKYEIFPIYVDKSGEWYSYNKNINEIDILSIDEEPLEIEKINNIIDYLKELDIIFPVLHGLYGEDGSIQGLFKLIDKKYVGCDILSSSICMNKLYTKIIFEKAGIKEAKSIYLNVYDDNYTYIDETMNYIDVDINKLNEIIKDKLKYPVFIKPSNSGSSVGVNKASNIDELDRYIKEASKYDKEILIEEEIIGREVECAVLGNDKVEASTVGEILSANDFYDYDSKYKNEKSIVKIPANLDKDIIERIRSLAVKAFKATHCKGLARIDFFVTKDNEIYINEINTMPGFTSISMYPKLWEEAGISYEELLDKLILLASK